MKNFVSYFVIFFGFVLAVYVSFYWMLVIPVYNLLSAYSITISLVFWNLLTMIFAPFVFNFIFGFFLVFGIAFSDQLYNDFTKRMNERRRGR